jgi:DNA-binding CsgD family transcriptional regulator
MLSQPNRNAGASASIDIAAPLQEARAAWDRGDFVACEQALVGLSCLISPAQHAELVLLRARALLRLNRPEDAAECVAPALMTLVGDDEQATGQMLLGTAVARSGQVDRGMALLDDAADFASERSVHRAIVAEIDYYRALTLRQRGDIDLADRRAEAASLARADIISARAAALRGWIASDAGRYREAHGFFSAAGRAIESSRVLDLDLSARVAHELAMLECDLRSSTLSGGHRERYQRDAATPIVSASSAPVSRLLALVYDAWAFALDGDVTCALDRIWQAESFGRAAGRGWLAVAMTERAAVTRALGEVATARKFAEMAADLIEADDSRDAPGGERFALLTLADELVRFDVARGARMLMRYESLRADERSLIHSHDLRVAAQEHYTTAVVRRELGDQRAAHIEFREAYTLYRRFGYLWRAARALIELDATPLPGARQNALETAALIVREHFPRSFLVPLLGPWTNSIAEHAADSLKPHLREVLRLLAAGGHSTKEIAARTGKTPHTIRSYTRDLRVAFGAHSTPALLARARERGFI